MQPARTIDLNLRADDTPTLGPRWIGRAYGHHVPSEAVFIVSVYVCGVHHHLQGIQVGYDQEHGQRAAYAELEEELSDLFVLATPDAPFHTVEIEGREYVIFMTPSAS